MKKTNTNKNKKKTPKKVNSKPKPKARAKAKTRRPSREEIVEGVYAAANAERPEIMDRPTLIGITRLLKDAGSDVKALKSDSDSDLQKKLNDAIQRLPPAEVVKQLEAIDPNKLVGALKLDCLGIFIDLTDVSCVHCPDAKMCAGKFIENIRGGFAHVKGAETKPEAKAEAPKAGVTPVTRYEAGRLLFVRDVKNPNPKGDDYHDSIQRVLDEQPETLGELRAILEDDFDFDGDGDFMKFVTALRDPKEGVIKLDVDLSDKDKAALRAAGYDV